MFWNKQQRRYKQCEGYRKSKHVARLVKLTWADLCVVRIGNHFIYTGDWIYARFDRSRSLKVIYCCSKWKPVGYINLYYVAKLFLAPCPRYRALKSKNRMIYKDLILIWPSYSRHLQFPRQTSYPNFQGIGLLVNHSRQRDDILRQ